MRSLIHILLLTTLTMMITLHALPKKTTSITPSLNSRPRLEQTEHIIRPLIPPDALGMALLFRKDSFTKVFDLIRGRPYEEGESMMPSNFDLFPALRYHDAAQDDNFALRNWFDLDSSKKKLEQLKILLLNPTVDFSIEHSFVLEQASEFGDLEVIKKIVESGASPTAEAVIQASKYGQEKIVNYYLDYEYWNRRRLVILAAGHGDLGLFKSLIEKPEFKEDLDDRTIEIFWEACYSGNLELVQFLIPFLRAAEDDEQSLFEGINIGVSYAVHKGSIETVKSILEMFNLLPDRKMVEASIIGGNHEVFDFFVSQGLTGFQEDELLDEDFTKNWLLEAFDSACKKAPLEFVAYMIEKFRIVPNSFSLENAIADGNLDVAMHFMKNYHIKSSKRLDRLLKRRGVGWKADRRYYDFLNILSEQFNYEYDLSDLKFAAEQNNFFYARYLLSEQQIIPTQEIFMEASSACNQQLMRFLVLKYGFSPDIDALETAARWGNLDEILFLTRRGIYPDQSVLHRAILSCEAEKIVKYFVQDLGLIPMDSALILASFSGKLNLVKYMIQTIGLTPMHETMTAAVLNNILFGNNEDPIDYLIGVDNNLRASKIASETELARISRKELLEIYQASHKKRL